MKSAGIFLLSFVVVAGSAYSDTVWFLPRDCSGPDLSLSVLFEGEEILQSRGPACVSYSENRDGQWKKETLSFDFQPKQAITWTGYRDEPFDSPKGAKLTIDLWLAGADRENEVWLIGVSIRDTDTIYMKTIHSANLTAESASCLVDNFCIQTTIRPPAGPGRSDDRIPYD